MEARAWIDPNVRVRGDQTFVGFEDCAGMAAVGDEIEIEWAETQAWTVGIVTDIDFARRLVYIALDWSSLRECPRSFAAVSAFTMSSPA